MQCSHFLCCGNGKVELSLLQNPPKYLYQLLYDHGTSDSKNYQQNIRTYNIMFAFTSAGIKFDKSINHLRGPSTIRIQGQPCHRIGSMLPMPGKEPKFAQLYIFDTENEVQNRINAISEMLDEYNVHAKTFRIARDRLQDVQVNNIKLKLIANREKDGRTYNVPTVPEVAALIVGNFDANSKRDIIIETHHGQLQRIHELHSSYLALQYPLLFPYGEDGYRPDILHSSRSDGKKRKINLLTMREWFSYRLQCRSNESITLLNSRRLFQQFVVDGYTMVESERLSYFCSLQQSLDDGSRRDLNKGKRVILPSTFVGSPRYMDQLYFDGMAIYEIDQIISAEIPSQQDDLELYSLVKKPYGSWSMWKSGSWISMHEKGKCSRFYPKMFQPHTVLDADGFPVYRRRNNGNAIEKNGVIIDNRYIVPYNPRFIRKYQAHINIEWCNQSTSIKYLFKYINKGYDRVIAILIDEDNDQTENGGTHNDEIKEYLDYRKPAVERLHFHLPGQHSVLYEDHDDIDDELSKPSISDSKFISWMNTNQNSVEGRNLTYAELVSKFVYNQKKKCWHLRKKGYTIGRLLWVPPITGELFYLRMMLTVCKGPTSFEDLRTIDNVQYSTYKEASKDWGSTHYIRKLFVLLLLTATMSKPEQVWDQTWHWMANDIVYNYKKSSTSPALQLDDRTLQNLVLLEIEELLQANQRSLRDYPSMPYLEDANCPTYLDNSLILAELNYNNEELR
ncbi:hypothetical protein AAZX31_03G084400 [Glycine max]